MSDESKGEAILRIVQEIKATLDAVNKKLDELHAKKKEAQDDDEGKW